MDDNEGKCDKLNEVYRVVRHVDRVYVCLCVCVLVCVRVFFGFFQWRKMKGRLIRRCLRSLNRFQKK